MKLARPDLFHPRIVLAGCPALPEGDGDDAGLLAALGKHGLHARWLSWDDPATLEADLVILRATWDYIDRLDEFLGWAGRVRNLLNPARVVPWNTDKRYLLDLADAGVPIVPSRFFGPGATVRLPNSAEVVVKPAVGVGSVDTVRFSDRDDARRHAARLLATGRTVLIQPYDARIEDGETALVFLGGSQSHAFTKGPILRRAGQVPPFDESGTYARETLTPAEPDFEVWDVGHAALAAAAAHLDLAPEELLYARVDVVGGRFEPRVLEVELVEPSLGWMQLDPPTRERQQRAFVLGVESALERFGLGPLSHRRP
ncbi:MULTISPECIES: hypothetical protein [unclassified Mycobacterium]|uniref:ATP-grasp domain-containing protein n=1 Tax=unclassified Mycobacterium TaxID=2642494 RepID=UPI00073FAA68|nr:MULTISPECIES: hypothetical protein [unclassified Mycobacterium]KUH87528.1 hypothetical protein AU186_02745 [Mycobacterium sp. GA-1999]KUH90297.1 hypothetical protein AU187_22455 [Mycobacterium sp. IS-1556]KUH90803.1 hypothetical protein AU185_03650 [Mycobacterium sp. GA-0227b]